jgi:hypothetical protein
MQIVFEFVGGPLGGERIVGDSAGERDEATALYDLTRQGTVGVRFIEHSKRYRQAIEQLEAGEIDDVGGPYDEYLYEVVQRSEDEAGVRIRVKFVGRAIGGLFDAAEGEGLV